VRKLIDFDDETLDKLTQLGRDRMATLQELADEAFADLLKKHGISHRPQGRAAQERRNRARAGQAQGAIGSGAETEAVTGASEGGRGCFSRSS